LPDVCDRPRDSINIFIDNSNIMLGARSNRVDLDVGKLARVVQKGRKVERRLVVGSTAVKPNQQDKDVFNAWQKAGYKVHTSVRPQGHKEQFVDEACVAMVLREVVWRPQPATIVLLTGDGNDNDGRPSFFDAVAAALFRGWRCEVWSWKSGLNARYRALERAYKDTDRCSFHFLDDVRAKITKPFAGRSSAVKRVVPLVLARPSVRPIQVVTPSHPIGAVRRV